MTNIFRDWDWCPSSEHGVIETVDMHTGGEPLRVIISGLASLEGSTVLEKRRHFAERHDQIRTALMWEPRGHADMYGAVMTRAADDADFDVFFLHNEGYSTMCGHAIIALTRLVSETALVPENAGEIRFNVPAGRIVAWPERQGRSVIRSRFRNVASYVALPDAEVEVPPLGRVKFDVCYGGAFYAVVEAEPIGLELTPGNVARLIDYGRRIKLAVAEAYPIAHPVEPDLSFLYGTIFTGRPEKHVHHSRNVCIFADGEVDRSPTGSGVSARAALHYARGEIAIGDSITIESILGSTMSVRVSEKLAFNSYSAVIPEVSGTSHFTGRSRFWIERDDPLGYGFLVR